MASCEGFVILNCTQLGVWVCPVLKQSDNFDHIMVSTLQYFTGLRPVADSIRLSAHTTLRRGPGRVQARRMSSPMAQVRSCRPF